MSIFILGISFCVFAQSKKKVLLVIVDGIPADVIEKQNPPSLSNIKTIGNYTRAYVGGIKDTYSETPTISAVGYNSVLTGIWANKHNVWDNDIKDPNYNYPTIFRYYKESHPKGTVGIFSSWLDNRTKLVGDRFAPTGNIAIDYSDDGLELDTVRFPHDRNKDYMNRIDDSVTVHAANCIKNQAPDLSWVYLEYTDDMGHKFGDSPEFYNAIKLADQRIGQLYQAVQYREKTFHEDWLVVITTDHGRDAKTGKGHGGQSERERSSWIVTNKKNVNEQFNSQYCSIVDIAPTINQFLGVKISEKNQFELDGVPFIGKIDARFVGALKMEQGDMNGYLLTWDNISKSKNKAIIWIANSNEIQNGDADQYKQYKKIEVKNKQGTILIPLSEFKPGINKIVLQTPNNTLNTWVKL